MRKESRGALYRRDFTETDNKNWLQNIVIKNHAGEVKPEIAPVVTDIPANQPWINEGENGLLFPVGDHSALAARIAYLLKNREMREDFGRRSRQIVQQKAEEQTEMEKIDSIYAELIKGG